MKQCLYSSYVIINPRRGIISDAQVKRMKVFHDAIRIGDKTVTFASMLRCVFEHPCVVIETGDTNVRFGVQERLGRGLVSADKAYMVVGALNAACRHDKQMFDEAIGQLKNEDRIETRCIAAIVTVLLLVSVMGVFVSGRFVSDAWSFVALLLLLLVVLHRMASAVVVKALQSRRRGVSSGH